MLRLSTKPTTGKIDATNEGWLPFSPSASPRDGFLDGTGGEKQHPLNPERDKMENVGIKRIKPNPETERIIVEDFKVSEPAFVLPKVIDKWDDTEKLVAIAPHKANLCLFHAIFNSLRDPAQRNAFSGGNPSQPTLAFLSYIHSDPSHSEKVAHGYTSLDILNYLKYLKDNKYISTFTWKSLKVHPDEKFGQLLIKCFNGGFQSGQSVILLGSSIPNDVVAKLRKSIRGSSLAEQVSQYIAAGYKTRVTGETHASSISNGHIFDSGKQIPLVADPLNLLRAVVHVHHAYAFSLVAV